MTSAAFSLAAKVSFRGSTDQIQHFERLIFSDFVSAPEPTVYIPVNGEASLYCEHEQGDRGLV